MLGDVVASFAAWARHGLGVRLHDGRGRHLQGALGRASHVELEEALSGDLQLFERSGVCALLGSRSRFLGGHQRAAEA